MFEIIVAIIVVVCIIYIFKGEFTGRNAGVTVLESLPLSIFKKWVKEEKNTEESIELKDIKFSNSKSNSDELLEEIAIDILNEENKEVGYFDQISNISEENSIEKNKTIESLENINKREEDFSEAFDKCTEDISEVLVNDVEESIEFIEENNEEVEEVKEDIVYWTPNGKTYHAKNTCRTLARSKVINSGAIHESGKDFKCENCK